MRTITTLGAIAPGLSALIVTLFGVGFANVSANRNIEGDQTQAFETASITSNTTGTRETGSIKFQPKGRLAGANVTLEEMIKFAYQRHFFDEREVSGGPAWAAVDRFDLSANISPEHVFDSDGFPGYSLVCCEHSWRSASSCRCKRRTAIVPSMPS